MRVLLVIACIFAVYVVAALLVEWWVKWRPRKMRG